MLLTFKSFINSIFKKSTALFSAILLVIFTQVNILISTEKGFNFLDREYLIFVSLFLFFVFIFTSFIWLVFSQSVKYVKTLTLQASSFIFLFVLYISKAKYGYLAFSHIIDISNILADQTNSIFIYVFVKIIELSNTFFEIDAYNYSLVLLVSYIFPLVFYSLNTSSLNEFKKYVICFFVLELTSLLAFSTNNLFFFFYRVWMFCYTDVFDN